MVSQFDTEATRGRLTFISTDFAGASYYFARVRSSFDRLECGKFYIISNETGGNVTIPDFNIVSTDGGESLTECCDVAVPTPPTIISPWHINTNVVDIKIAENTSSVTTIVATGDSPIVYSIASFGDGGKFKLDSTSGDLSFVTPPDFENPSDSGGNNIYTVKVIATNDVGSDELIMNVEVLDVDDTITIPIPPTIILPGNGGSTVHIGVPENTTDVSVVVATGDSPITYSIDSYGDSDNFVVDSTSGKLTFKTAPDFENPIEQFAGSQLSPYTYLVRVSATNASGSDSIQITVQVLDVPEGQVECPIDGNVEDSCLEVILKTGHDAEHYQKVAGIYEYNPNDSAYTNTDLSVDNSKPHWIKADGSGVEIFFVYVEDHPSDDYTDFGGWYMTGPGALIAPAMPWGYGPSAGPPWNAQIPSYPWCKGPDQGYGIQSLWGFADVEQVECPPDVEIPCCDGFTYTHDKSTEDDPTQTGEQYGDVELQKSKNPFPSIETQYPQWNVATLCHNGATGGIPSRSPIDIVTIQDYLGMTAYPYKHGEIALGSEHTGEMRITLVNGDCYHACVSPDVSEVIFTPSSEPLNCGG